ncbi:MAG TPA: nucleoside hydrolase [Terracidiphilus sp.]|nr:nucleoside hydrolase [Terracidiphilus sp.]
MIRRPFRLKAPAFLVCFVILAAAGLCAQSRRYVVIDQDAMGPAGTDMNSILVFLQSPDVDVLGITVVTGDAWRDEEVAHALRLLELMGRTDIPVVPGRDHPMLRTREWTRLWEQMYGKVSYQGAWTMPRSAHAPDFVPALAEGAPATRPDDEDVAHFLSRMVHKYPHQVTIYAAGPMTDIAAAILYDPQFASLAKELVIMGGSINPVTSDPEFTDNPHREFNLWFDPEASSITLHAPWAKITATTVDVSVETQLTKEMVQKLAASPQPAAQYIAAYTTGRHEYLWDELAAAAWIDPSLITRERYLYMDVSLDKGISYGDTEVWTDKDKPAIPLQKVHAQMDVDWPKFQELFMHLMTSPTPGAKNPQMLRKAPDR